MSGAGPGGRGTGMTRSECERYFRRQGLPLLVEDHSLRRDVWGRSAPFLLVVLLLELTGSIDGDWRWWQNLLAVLGAFAILAGLFAGLNLVLRRPWHTLPQSVGPAELAFFVLAPALATWLVGAGWGRAALLALTNLVVLGGVRLVVGYGLGSAMWWGSVQVVSELRDSMRRLVRLLPLVLIFSIVLFYNDTIWLVFDRISGPADIALGAFFLLLVVGLTALGARREADAIIADAAGAVPDGGARFTPPQYRNVVAMVAGTQLLQVLLVTVATALFFVALGTLTVGTDVRAVWQVGGGTWSQTLWFLGTPLVVDQTLVRVAVAVATFNGFYYAMNVQVDALYRSELIEDLTARLHRVVQVRAHYLRLLSGAR